MENRHQAYVLSSSRKFQKLIQKLASSTPPHRIYEIEAVCITPPLLPRSLKPKPPSALGINKLPSAIPPIHRPKVGLSL
jgi:hypothetical protein